MEDNPEGFPKLRGLNTKIIRDVLIIATLKSLPDLKRQPLMMGLVGLISALPLFFILVFGAEISYGIIGALVATIGFIGLNSAIQDMAYDRYLKISEIIVSMPVHSLSYALGVAMAPLLLSFPGIAFFTALALWLGILSIYSLFWAFAILLLCWTTLSSFGFLISTYLRGASVYTLNNMSNMLGLILVFVPPVYYTEEILGSVGWLAMVFPTSNAAGLIRTYSGSLDSSPTMILIRWGILIGTLLIFAAITITKSKWRES